MAALVVLAVCGAASAAASAPGVAGRELYVSPDGDDANPGTSPDRPWRTLARVNAADLHAGDRVHLRGGATFVEPLAPWAGTAGTARSPIVFDSYGPDRATLRGGIYLNSVSDLSFTRLIVKAPPGKGIFSSAAGSGVQRIIIRDVAVQDTPLAGISSNNRADSDWLIDHVRISHTGDSGVYFMGSGLTVTRSAILDTGLDARIPYPRHGIYAKGAGATLTGNVISRFSTSGISLRREDSVVTANRITGGTKGISFDDEATAAGTTRIARNSISAVSDSGIALASARWERFLVSGNTAMGAWRFGVYLGSVRDVTLAGNTIVVPASATAVLGVRPPARSYREHHNRWRGGPARRFVWDGSPRTFAAYRRLSGEGASDVVTDPPGRP